MKVSELTGAKLDYWVAKAENHELLRHNPQLMPGGVYAKWEEEQAFTSILYSPSTDWNQGGPIIERERISVDTDPWKDLWHAQLAHAALQNGVQRSFATSTSPLIAAMRAYVASKFGDEVADIT